MLLELFLFLELLAIVSFTVGFFRQNIWFWAFALLLLGTLVFASYNIEQNVSVVTNQTMVGNTIQYENVIMTKQVADPAYSIINIGFFGIALILFLSDLFTMFGKGRVGER